jgi:FixJ family two-component response regulator
VTAAAVREQPGQEETRSGVVYIVDDDQELCTSLAWLLGSVDIDALTFSDATSFLDSYVSDRPACIVLDVRMPEIGGFGVQGILSRAGSTIPIIFVSAHGDIRMSVRALQNGAVDFLEKPYNPQHMLDVVQAALRTARESFARESRRRALQARLDALTSRELEVLHLVIDGVPSKLIAGRLGISVKTVDVHRTRIREKSGADSIAILVRDVLRLGLRLPDVR